MANYLTRLGMAMITNRLAGSGTEPKYIGWGTGGTGSSASTNLATEAAQQSPQNGHTVGTSSRVTTTYTNDTYQVVGTCTAGGSITVTEAGLFDAALSNGAGAIPTQSGANLFVLADSLSIALTAGDSIQFTFQIQFS